MFPSSSRVKLNRVALKGAAPKVAPLRRRPCKTVTTDSTEKHGHGVLGVVSEEETASVPCSSNDCQTLFLCEKRPNNPTETQSSEPGGWLENCVVTKKAKNTCTREDMECKNTRGKYLQSTPNPRRKLRLAHQRSVSFRFSFTCCSDSDCLKSTGGRSQVRTIKISSPMKLHSKAHLAARAADRRPGAGAASFRAARGGGLRSRRSAAGTPSLPRPASSIDRKSPSEPDGSQGYLRRSVGAPHCVLCGEGKCLPPQQKNLVQQVPKSSSLGSELATAEVKRGNGVTEETSVWKNKYPKVKLCDIAKILGTCSHNCGYVLSDVLQTKVVHCFKRDLKAGFWIWPTCLDHKHKRKDWILVKNNQSCVPVEKSLCQSRISTEHQNHLDKEMDSQTTQTPTPRLHSSWTEEDSSAASSLPTEVGECRTSLRVENSEQESNLMEAETHGGKRIKSVDGVGCSRTCSSDLKENWIIKNLGDERDPTEVNVTLISSDVCSESDEAGANHPETFTCQRVKAYKRKISYSCARTYMSWPFSSGSAGSADPSVAGSQIQTSSPTKQSKNTFPGTGMEKRDALSEDKAARCTNVPSHRNRPNMKMMVCSVPSEGSPSSLQSDAILFSISSVQERNPGDGASTSPFSANEPETDSSISTPCSTALGQGDWETPLSGPSTGGASCSLSGSSHSLLPSLRLSVEVKDGELQSGRKILFCGDNQLAASSFSSSVPSTDSRSPSLLHHGKHKNDTFLTDRSPPKLEPYDASPFKSDSSLLFSLMDSSEFRLPPVLSPVNSPLVCWWKKSLLCQSSEGSVNEENVNKDTTKTSPEYHMEQVNSSEDNSEDCGDLAEAHSSPSSDEDDHTTISQEEEQLSDAEESNPLELAGKESYEAKGEAADDAVLDEFTAYEKDILLVDVIQDDLELFQNIPKQSLLKLGPTRQANVPQKNPTAVVTGPSRMGGASSQVEQRLMPVIKVSGVPGITEESDSRPWRPRFSTTPSKIQNACPATYKQTRHVGQLDANNNPINDGLERGQSILNVPSLLSPANWPWIKNTANMMSLSHQNSNSYCRQYFSESTSCGYKMCRFQHLPVEGDEKFCVETVARFTKNPVCLQKAGAVFTGYYQNNPPGTYFSVPVLRSLLWALLKAGMVLDVFSVLTVSLAHNIVPGHDFLLAVFSFVRRNSHVGFIPTIMQLTLKMASIGLELNLDCLDCVKNTPMFQQMVHPNSSVYVSGSHSSTLTPEYLRLAHAAVEVELCIKQEDWKQMGEVFKTICQYHQHPNQVERISGRIAIALLCESKNSVSLPFAVFTERVCQSEDDNSPIRSFVGRIGVSLMLRYHKNQQWFKGRKVVEVMSTFKVGFTTLKGLFGNEDGASRCCLITMATDLLLLTGSVEGALKMLRENDWFLSSCLWPCDAADLEGRTNVLVRLAKKTSHRDTMEVLCNLPGIKEPNPSINISMYSPLFNTHLQVCVEKQMLPVAADTVEFMLCKNLPVDHSVLQILLQKLGKQNLWLRAREVFKRSLSAGNYPEVSAPPGLMTLTVPCKLSEVELALIFEMFITINSSAILLPETTPSSLSITLKRTESNESGYISAGNSILSAAALPQPKLLIHYSGVNSTQEQEFRLDGSSASRWFLRNRVWASEMWTT